MKRFRKSIAGILVTALVSVAFTSIAFAEVAQPELTATVTEQFEVDGEGKVQFSGFGEYTYENCYEAGEIVGKVKYTAEDGTYLTTMELPIGYVADGEPNGEGEWGWSNVWDSNIGSTALPPHLSYVEVFIRYLVGGIEKAATSASGKGKPCSLEIWGGGSCGEEATTEEIEEFVEIIKDMDTCKSEVAADTITTVDGKPSDIKVHATEVTNVANQIFLAETLLSEVGEEVGEVLLTADVFPGVATLRMNKGEEGTLVWNDLKVSKPGVIYAIVYNPVDGAYMIKGYVDENGTATFEGFIFRDASTVSFVLPK